MTEYQRPPPVPSLVPQNGATSAVAVVVSPAVMDGIATAIAPVQSSLLGRIGQETELQSEPRPWNVPPAVAQASGEP